MRKQLLKLFISGAAVPTLGLTPGGILRGDTIFLVDGKKIENVTIVEAKYDGVKYKLSGTGSPQQLKGNEVLSVERQSAKIREVRDAFEKGNFEEAEQKATAIVASGSDTERSEGLFLKGLILQRAAELNESKGQSAIAALNEFINKEKPNKDFFVPHATESLAKVYLALKSYPAAVENFKALQGFAPEGGIWAIRGKLGLAWATLLEKGEKGALDARQLFSEVRNDRQFGKSFTGEAVVGIAAVSNSQQQYDNAVTEIQKNFIEPTEIAYDENFAAAMNQLGIAFLGKKDLAEAEFAFLQTTCFFGAQFPQHYRVAAQNLARIYEQNGNADRKKFWEEAAKKGIK